ncbi:hemerythrin-like metal-binding protein [Chloroherpeton thalassium ATCC 35110]|uniref:Hemerythrin-like metal-binding protein n=1 Tax=Chloroherpeton thalassium (strain ATCC 35110 / GB-78) TaxID=517418 RepID=B3QSP6_CHLT3|nr:hemerythrin family protein [Chloroherpeton thalassium]ACF14093.1 hemerythrin-like metal-binding protein [Chloroherpeton thalassium ATCC 35110]
MGFALTPWSSDFENGIIWQDLQHRELVQAVHKLYGAIASKQDDSVIQSIIEFLHDYTKNHFDMEERYMEETHYPELLSHVERHKEFIDMLENFEAERVQSKYMANLSLCYDLNEWTLKHIRTYDRQLAIFLQNERGLAF